MVTLNRIYTRTGDKGSTRLATGEPVSKASLRVEAYGGVDETNACIGLVRLHTDGELDAILSRIQNDLFDLGADLATPDTGKDLGYEPLRIVDGQVERLEREIDQLNAELSLHLARTVCRRAERSLVALMAHDEKVSAAALKYLNRLSDLLFVAARFANGKGADDVLWVPGASR